MRFKGIFVRYGEKKAYKGPPLKTVLLKDIENFEGKIITDHLWFNYTKGFEALGEVTEGDLISFDGRVKQYGLVNC